MLTTIRERAEARLSELSREYFMHHAGFKQDLAMAPIIRQYEDLMTPETQQAIRSAWDAATDPVERRQLGYLYGDCLRNVMRRDLAEPSDAQGRAQAKAVVEFEGETLSYPQASMAIGNTHDRDRRKRLSAATRAVSAALNTERVAVLETERAIIRDQLGFPHYRAFYEMVRGIDFAGMGTEMEAFLAETRADYDREMGAWSQAVFGLPHTELESHDIIFLRRASNFDSYFPADKLVPTLNATLKGLGLDPENLGSIQMDLDNRPGKSSRAFCMGVKIPGEIYLCITQGGGADDYQSLLHEMGHALHFGHAGSELPFEFRFTGDNSVCEAFAFNMEHVTLEPAWLSKHLGMDAEAIAAYRRHMYRMLFLNLRRFAAKHLFELALHDERPVADKGAVYAETLTRHLGVTYFPEEYLSATDGGFYTAQYFRAWCLEAQLKRVLKAKFGEAWFESAEAGAFMKSLWEKGQSLPGDELARHLGYDGITPDALMEEVRAALA